MSVFKTGEYSGSAFEVPLFADKFTDFWANW